MTTIQDFETYELANDNAPTIRFSGTLIATADTHYTNGNENPEWVELELYKTAGGKFICHQMHVKRSQYSRNRYRTGVAETEAEVIRFFGHRWLAQRLYKDAGIEDVITVE